MRAGPEVLSAPPLRGFNGMVCPSRIWTMNLRCVSRLHPSCQHIDNQSSRSKAEGVDVIGSSWKWRSFMWSWQVMKGDKTVEILVQHLDSARSKTHSTTLLLEQLLKHFLPTTTYDLCNLVHRRARLIHSDCLAPFQWGSANWWAGPRFQDVYGTPSRLASLKII